MVNFTFRGSAVNLKNRVGSIGRLFGLLALVASLVGPALTPPALAQEEMRDPREIILTHEEGGGKDSYPAADEDCSDDRARCVHRRWERDGETDASVGPIITDTRVWVAKDVETAKAIYKEQEKKQKEFPERTDYANGPFPFEFKDKPPAEEWTALSACIKDACASDGRIDIHQRMLARRDKTVILLYLFGRERNTTPELTTYFMVRSLERV